MYQNIVKKYMLNKITLNYINRSIVGKKNRLKFFNYFLENTRYKYNTDLLRDLRNKKSY